MLAQSGSSRGCGGGGGGRRWRWWRRLKRLDGGLLFGGGGAVGAVGSGESTVGRDGASAAEDALVVSSTGKPSERSAGAASESLRVPLLRGLALDSKVGAGPAAMSHGLSVAVGGGTEVASDGSTSGRSVSGRGTG